MKITFTTRDGSLHLGVNDGAGWAVEVAGRVVGLDRREAFRTLLPLLEEDPRHVMQSLNACIKEDDLAPFPAQELILHALQFASAYWKELALHWLESLGVWSAEIEEQLDSLAAKESKWPQALKHRALKIRRTLAR